MTSPPPLVAVRLRGSTAPVIHLWHASLAYPSWSELLTLLSEEELRRVDRFFFERDARRYVVSHAVLRTVLGRIIDVPPEEVMLETGAGGRPFLRNVGTRLHFSLSRSSERVLSAPPLAPSAWILNGWRRRLMQMVWPQRCFLPRSVWYSNRRVPKLARRCSFAAGRGRRRF